MCGISGIYSFDRFREADQALVETSVACLNKRGPDFRKSIKAGPVSLGHSRLSIIDTSSAANQPFTDDHQNYILVFNGEIFNFHELKSQLEAAGEVFKTNSDTEVLFHLLINEGKNALSKLRGFFAFAFYDRNSHTLLVARDRIGEKPLYFSEQNGYFYFSSELKGLLKFPLKKELNSTTLNVYFTLNYVPAPETLLKNIFCLEPGTSIEISPNGVHHEKWYTPENKEYFTDYNTAQNKLRESLEDAVRFRLISDVPIGSFLSGGIDSTIISGIAKKFKPDLLTFSIGFPDDPFFDETKYAVEASKYLNTNHEVINVTSAEMDEAVDDVLNYLDHPFADSSAIPFYLLCRSVKNKITVALSGDGADELFGGYNKHRAWVQSTRKNLRNTLLKYGGGMFSGIAEKRHSSFSNKLRQLKKYSKGLKFDPAERYLHWASFTEYSSIKNLFHPTIQTKDPSGYLAAFLPESGELNDALLSDIKMVLANDMLVKVDRMSMANSIEIRPPFLDNDVIETALSIPGEWKTNTEKGKIILRDAFSDLIPDSIQSRGKKGFEVPLQRWMETTLYDRIKNEWLETNFIREQGIFNPEFIEELKKNIPLTKSNPHTVWALIVFQNWWKKYMM